MKDIFKYQHLRKTIDSCYIGEQCRVIKVPQTQCIGHILQNHMRFEIYYIVSDNTNTWPFQKETRNYKLTHSFILNQHKLSQGFSVF